MEATLLNTNFEAIAVIDTYVSFIWTDRYDEAGDFELKMRMNPDLLAIFKKDYYLWTPKSDRLMIIETLSVESDVEEGAIFTVAGRSLESLLMRRIVWKKTTFSIINVSTGEKPNLQNGIKKLLTENLINPSISIRKIPDFIFEESTDPKITSLTFEAQYFGEDLYSIVHSQCRENEIGFKVTLNADNQFVFKLYAGVDRSYEQITNPYVIFSPSYDNVLNTNYLDSVKAYKNVTLVAGENETDANGEEIARETYVLGNAFGIDRREIFTDASSLSYDDGDGGTLSAAQYQAHLRQKGIDTLIKNVYITAFEGEIDPNRMYKYGEDYFIGDIVQIANEYGQEGRAYISEYVISCDTNGLSTYPTFQTIQEGVYDA